MLRSHMDAVAMSLFSDAMDVCDTGSVALAIAVTEPHGADVEGVVHSSTPSSLPTCFTPAAKRKIDGEGRLSSAFPAIYGQVYPGTPHCYFGLVRRMGEGRFRAQDPRQESVPC